MMILVGVTVSVVMQGGLFDKATIAVIKQETATMQEYIVTKGADMLADKAKDGDELNVTVEEILQAYGMALTEINFEETPDYISNVDVDPERTCYLLDASKLHVDSSRGNGTIETGKDIFVVDSNKRVYYVIEGKTGQGGDIPPEDIPPEDIPPEETAPEALLDYILGVKDETTGLRPGKELADIFSIQGGFIDIPEELQTGNLIGNLRFITRSAVSTEVVTKTDTEGNTTYEQGINMDFYFTYEGTRYKFRAITNQYGTEGLTLAKVGVKDLSYDTTSKVGKYVSYDNKYWIILYDDSENGLQMISSDVIKDENGRAIEYYLGDGDSTFTEDEVTEIDGVTSEKSDLEKTMYSYNNAVTTLNTICEGLVTPKEGVIKGVRCVGSNPITPNEDNSKAFIGSVKTIPGYGTSTWFEDNLNLQLNKTEERTYYTIKGTDPAQEYSIKDTDLNYEKDFDRMVALGINAKDDSYWLASRIINTEASRVGFNMRCELWGDGGGCELLRVLSEKVNCTTFGEAVRPVVILEQGALEGLTGDGLTWGTAYKIETPESPEEPVDPDPEVPVVPEEPSETDATEILDIGATINGEAPSSTNPFIPAGFKAVNTATSSWNATNTPDTENGLVIADANKNQFVWIPVSNINEMAMCKTCGSSANSLNTQTAQCTNCGENTILIGKLYNGSTVIEYSDSGSREPVALTSAGETATQQTQYENNYKAMVESVAKFGGFYIGRYETSADSTGIAQSKKSTDENVIVSANASTNGSWAGLYSLQRTYTTDSVQSEMIWGSQYDAMVRWLGTTAANSGYNQTRNPGTASGDLIKNIYDIYGNSYEWTQEAYSTNARTERGGDNASGGSLAIDYRCTGLGGYAYITSTFVDNGSRMTLYIIEEAE